MTHTDLADLIGMPPQLCERLKKECYVRTIEAFVFRATNPDGRADLEARLGSDAVALDSLVALAKAHVAAITDFRKIEGVVEGYFETGTEGVIWSVYEDGKTGYDGLNEIEEFDHLTVFDSSGSVLFDGEIHWDWKVGWHPYPRNPSNGQQVSLGMWVHGIQTGWEPDAWGRLFLQLRGEPERPPHRATLIKKPPRFES